MLRVSMAFGPVRRSDFRFHCYAFLLQRIRLETHSMKRPKAIETRSMKQQSVET